MYFQIGKNTLRMYILQFFQSDSSLVWMERWFHLQSHNNNHQTYESHSNVADAELKLAGRWRLHQYNVPFFRRTLIINCVITGIGTLWRLCKQEYGLCCRIYTSQSLNHNKLNKEVRKPINHIGQQSKQSLKI